jgi:peptide/nickel transport system ATP-binding protein
MTAPATPPPGVAPVLSLRGLEVRFQTEEGEVTPVRGVDLDVFEGRVSALVGESGSGKSVTSLAVMGLLPRPAGRIGAGTVTYTGKDGVTTDLAAVPARGMRRFRGGEIAMIFQEPMTSLNPVLSVGEQIAEQVRLHMGLDRAAAWRRAEEMLGLVEIPDASRRAHDYPHQMSGGMRQRVMIAVAMSCNPRLLIADEPTTALDVTIQAQILALIDRLRKEYGMGVLFITHNLGVVAEVADTVSVMYAGEVVESADVRTLFRAPRHPYTRALVDCLPARATPEADGVRRVRSIPGTVATAFKAPGCRFAPRCTFVEEACAAERPRLVPVAKDHVSRCLKWRALA